MADPLAKMRAICAKLPDVTEAPHHGRIAFKARGKLFATASADIVALQPDAKRREALLAAGVARPYPRDERGARRRFAVLVGQRRPRHGLRGALAERHRL